MAGRKTERISGASCRVSCLLALLAAVCVAVVAGCDRKAARPAGEAKKIVIAAGTWPASAPIFVAQEKGFFAEEGLDATIQPVVSGHLGLQAVLEGKADLASVGETPIARDAVDRKPLAVLATICRIDRAILIIARKDRGIATAEDLKGKKIGLVAGTTADYFLHIYLTTAYIGPDDLQIVNYQTEALVDALVAGEVDAISTWAPFTTAAAGRLGDNAVVLDEPGLYTMTWNMVATPQTAARDGEAIQRFLRAIIRANEFISHHGDEAQAITARSVAMDPAVVRNEWGNYAPTAVLDQSLVLLLEDQARWMTRGAVGETSQVPNFLEWIHAGALKAVRPEAVRIAGR